MGFLASTGTFVIALVAAASAEEPRKVQLPHDWNVGTRYHVEHAADWVVRLGDGTDESARRMRAALDRAWPYTNEMFARDADDAAATLDQSGKHQRLTLSLQAPARPGATSTAARSSRSRVP